MSLLHCYGKHALVEALSNGKGSFLQSVLITKQQSEDSQMVSLLQKHAVPHSIGTKEEIEHRVGRDAVHQGVCFAIDEKHVYGTLDDVRVESSHPCLVLLDELEDPHNVGAIIRSAVAFGASAVLMSEHNQAMITGTVVKSSVGLVFALPIIRIGNINTTVRALQEEGYWVYGLTGEGDTSLHDVVFDAPTVCIIGSEGKGIREKTLELCDYKLSIPMSDRCESLNASNAVAVTLYEWSRQQKGRS